MQRLFISRQLRRCAVCTLGGHMKLATMARAASAPQSLGGCGMCKRGALSYGVRWSSGEVHEEQPARSGQYLLDKNDVLTRVLEVVKNFEKVDASKVTPESHFINDLGLNSLDVVEVVFAIEQEFILDIPDHDAEKIQSIPDAVEYIAQNPMAK